MEANKKVIDGILPVTTDKAVYIDGTSTTVNDYLRVNSPNNLTIKHHTPVTPPSNAKAFFSIIDDDGANGSYTILKPVLDELNIKAGWGVITSSVGKNGNMIKEIGIRARKDIEKYFNKKVYLELFVKVIPKWRDKEKFLNMIGYKDFLNK